MTAYKEYKLKIVHQYNACSRSEIFTIICLGKICPRGNNVPSVSPSPSQVKILIDYVSPFVMSIGAPCLSVIVES